MTKSTLYDHQPHGHQPLNINEYKRQMAGLNERIALGVTKTMSAMTTFWLITAWIVLWIIANSTIAHFDPLPFPLLLALASIPQLPLMAVIMIGQSLLSKHQEIEADETFSTTAKTYHELEQSQAHLNAQDVVLLAMQAEQARQGALLTQLIKGRQE